MLHLWGSVWEKTGVITVVSYLYQSISICSHFSLHLLISKV